MASIIGILCLSAAGLLGLIWVLSKFKDKLPAKVATALATADAYADEGQATVFLKGAALLFKKHGDTNAVAELGTLLSKAWLWDEAVTATTANTAVTPTLESLAAQVAALKASAVVTTPTTPAA